MPPATLVQLKDRLADLHQECGLQRVDSHAFRDLRHCRNAINGMLDKDTMALTVFGKGYAMEPANDELHDVFGQLVLGLNDVGLICYGAEEFGNDATSAAFSMWSPASLATAPDRMNRNPCPASLLRASSVVEFNRSRFSSNMLVNAVIAPFSTNQPWEFIVDQHWHSAELSP